MAGKVLMVVTSCDHIDAGHETGLWLEEFALPYRDFLRKGCVVTVASPVGGAAPVDPRSRTDAHEGQWVEAEECLRSTRPLSAVTADNYDAVFLPGGHGTMFDLPGNTVLQQLLSGFLDQNKPIAAVCHGPCALLLVRKADGTPLVAGRRVTAFTDSEERDVKLDALMPFLLERELRRLGADFVAAANWSDHVEVDGLLITGQNPQSSASAARALLEMMSNRQ